MSFTTLHTPFVPDTGSGTASPNCAAGDSRRAAARRLPRRWRPSGFCPSPAARRSPSSVPGTSSPPMLLPVARCFSQRPILTFPSPAFHHRVSLGDCFLQVLVGNGNELMANSPSRSWAPRMPRVVKGIKSNPVERHGSSLRRQQARACRGTLAMTAGLL